MEKLKGAGIPGRLPRVRAVEGMDGSETLMEEWYHSKKNNRHYPTRLDFLVYAHDGRGLGHASRGIAIGLALRRMSNQCRTLFVSGCQKTETLSVSGELDWVKLPSYTTTIVDGRAEGGFGPSNFYKSVLGHLRSDMLASMMKTFRPRVVLVDHAPQGKRDELVRSLEVTENDDTLWVLGLRGVIGDDEDIWSDAAVRCVQQYYTSILWYGDSKVLGSGQLDTVEQRFGIRPIETGYVSRLMEFQHRMESEAHQLAGTVSIPWGNEETWRFVGTIHDAIREIGDTHGRWRLFVDPRKKVAVETRFRDLPFCEVHRVGQRYMTSLLQSKLALVYAGYNSIGDLLAARTPGVVLLRDLKDREQNTHLEKLLPVVGKYLSVLPEAEADTRMLQQALESKLHTPRLPDGIVRLDGAANAVSALHQIGGLGTM